jgi:hypothetical protein
MHWHGAEWAFGQGIVVDGLRVGAVTPRHMRSQQQRHCLPGEERRPETVPCVVQLVHTQACKCMLQARGGGGGAGQVGGLHHASKPWLMSALVL